MPQLLIGTRVRRGAAACCLIAASACARGPRPASAPIVTDRPDFTESPSTVPLGMAQAEAGYTAARDEDMRAQTVGELLVRVGIDERAELRIGVNSYVVADLDGGGRERGYEDPTLGFKLGLVRPDSTASRLVPELSLIGDATIPTRGGPFRESTVQPQALLAASWELGGGATFSANGGYAAATDDGTRFGQRSGSASLGYGFGERTAVFAEYFAFTAGPAGGAAHYLDGGLTYLLSPELQLDARGGVGANGRSPDGFWGVGVSARW
jgi:hypothetical protein